MNAQETKYPEFFDRPEWYDRGINWDARLKRELPVLTNVLGRPGEHGILDAGSGPGHQAVALAGLGYNVTCLDPDEGMLGRATYHAKHAAVDVRTVCGTYDTIADKAPGPFDGIICLGNALAAAASRDACAQAMVRFGACLRPGGKIFVQIVNFQKMREEKPCVRGPRVVSHDGVEYVSVRHFSFDGDQCCVTNTTMWREGESWRSRSTCGTLFAVSEADARQWCSQAGLQVENVYGGYDRVPFDLAVSNDLIFTACRASE